MIKKFIVLLSLFLFIGFSYAQPSTASDVDLLIKKLVEKKILSQEDATELINEIQKETTEKKDTPTSCVPKCMSKTKTKIKGDLRLRYEDSDLKTTVKNETKRTRLRLRAGIETAVNDKTIVGFGLATGGSGWDSARSTNQTLGENFGSKDIILDYAYATYSPCKYFSVTGGKIMNPLFNPGDLLWDTDIMPEGIATKLEFNITDGLDLSILPAFLYIADRNGSNDPNLWALEGKADWTIMEGVKLKAAATVLEFNKLKGSDILNDSRKTNSTFVKTASIPATADAVTHVVTPAVSEVRGYTYDYDSIVLGSALDFTNIGILPYMSVFGQYINASDPDNDNEGHLIGLKFGDAKVTKYAQWQFCYMYRRLEKDAWLDTYPDADVLGGDTGIKGSKFVVTFGVTENIALGLNYYDSKSLVNKGDEKKLQADFVFKF